MGSMLAKGSSTAAVVVVAAAIGTYYHYTSANGHTSESIAKSCYSRIDNLDDYLLIEILHRLPLKSASQCKIVSKRWHSLISSPYFVSRFGHNQPNKPFALIVNPKGSHHTVWPQSCHIFSKDPTFKSRPDLFELKFLPCFNPKESDRVCIIASYNDLLLCQDITFRSRWRRFDQQYYVCNPLTKNWVVLPPFPDKYKHKRFFVGFVHNHLDKEDSIRVVRILQDQGYLNAFVVMLYSSKKNQWAELLASHPYNLDIFRRSFLRSGKAFGCNAILHWLTTGNDIVAYNPYKPESCWLIKKPVGFGCYTCCLGVCEESLQLAQIDAVHGHGYAVRIWQLENYDTEEWMFKHELSLGPLVRELWLHEPELVLYVVSPKLLAVDPHKGNIVYMMVQGCVLSCNFETRLLKVEDRALRGLDICTDDDVFQLLIPIWPTTSLPPLPIRYPLNWPVVLRRGLSISFLLVGAGCIIYSVHRLCVVIDKFCKDLAKFLEAIIALIECLDLIAKIGKEVESKKKN